MSRAVVVTGAKGFIGERVCARLRADGAEVLELDLVLGHDLTDEVFTRSWFASHPAQALVNLFAVNDAVVADRKSPRALDLELASFAKCLNVNVVALFSVCREFVRSNPGGGAVVNFSSIYGVGAPYPALYGEDEKSIAYGVSKAAVIQLTRDLAVRFAPRFRFNSVVAGGIRRNQPETFLEAYAEKTPLGRMMEVDEAPGLVSFLVSGDASYCTGGVFPVDGGWTAW